MDARPNEKTMPRCVACGSPGLQELAHFGQQPISGRYLASPTEHEERFALALGRCKYCGLAQLTSRPPREALVPRHAWLSYREPSAHLEKLADAVLENVSSTDSPTACGLTFNDDPLLERLAARGCRTTRLDPVADLGIGLPLYAQETLQRRISDNGVRTKLAAHGTVDIVVVRYLVEHADNIADLLATVATLLRSGGLLVVEVPNCTSGLETCDLSMIWEEHTSYFTGDSLKQSLVAEGFAPLELLTYPDLAPGALVSIARRQPHHETTQQDSVPLSYQIGKRYPTVIEGWTRFLDDRLEVPRILIGAGHGATTFVNLSGIADRIDFAVDDAPAKQGYFLPGSRLPIHGRQTVAPASRTCCVMAVGLTAEPLVVRSFTELLGDDTEFVSISAESAYAPDFLKHLESDTDANR